MKTSIHSISGAFLLLSVTLTLFSFSSCNKQDELQTLADKVWEFAQTRPDGFTLKLSDFSEPDFGIAVAYKATQNCNTRESIPTVIKHAQEHDGYVGGWLDTGSGLLYFGSTKLFPEDERDAAIAFGKENSQQSAYVLSTGEFIDLTED